MRTLFFLMILLMMTACGGESTNESSQASDSGTSIISSISSAEKSLATSSIGPASSAESSISKTSSSIKSSLSSLASSTRISSSSSLVSSAASSKENSSAGSSVWTHGKNDQGFTQIKPSVDSRLIYVSNSRGDDTNDCLSENNPCKTIEAGRKKMRAGYPDHLYLKRGDVWRDQALHNFPSGRSVQEPAVIAFYGETGDRPKLENASQSTIGRGDVQFIHIIGLEFFAYKMNPDDPDFTGDKKANIMMINNHRDLLFEDNKFSYVEVIAHDYTDDKGNTFTPRNLTFRRNIWTGSYYNQTSYHRDIRPSNIYATVQDNLSLIENVFDHGGWNPDVIGAGANMYNHNIYLQGGAIVKTLVKGNIITRGSSHGIQMRSGGLAENNFFARNAVSLSIGYELKPMPPGTQAHAIDNVISEGMSMVKGVNPCQNNKQANLCTPAVFGIDLNTRASTGIDWLAKNNIVSLLGPDDGAWRSLWGNLSLNPYQSYGVEVPASNNIIWKWSPNSGEPVNNYPDPDRTLADYNEYLGGENSFEEFMEIVLNRPLQTWDEKYSAYGINDYIRAGFGISEK